MAPSHTCSAELGDVVEQLLGASPYTLRQAEKSALLARGLSALTRRHAGACEAYRKVLRHAGHDEARDTTALDRLPFLPVRLFKHLKLQSVADEQVAKVLTSSGTTSQVPSRIAVDRETSLLQMRALASIVSSFIGPKRLPMIIVDSPATVRRSESLSARGSGLVGLSNFGRDHFYALDESMKLDLPALRSYVQRFSGQPMLVFGFTFMVWKHFYQELLRSGESLRMDGAILIHGGGWKKLQDEAVSAEAFRSALGEQCGMRRVHDFYGMVEQVGNVFMECEYGFFHAPNMADVLVRDHLTWEPLPAGTQGLIQTVSVLPHSYPGHSLLTEDLGTVFGTDDCPCGRMGVRFKVHGRAPKSELRGCSDTAGSPMPERSGGVRAFFPRARTERAIEALCDRDFLDRAPMRPFDPLVVEFLDVFAAEVLSARWARESPDVMALAFWLRRANLHALVDGFKRSLAKGELAQPLGLAFHVAPSNVDTLFFYSWALGMLAGNLNVVRLPQALSASLQAVLSLLARVAGHPRWQPIAQRNLLVTYGHQDSANNVLSRAADARLVWGGDATVSLMRAFAAKPTTRDLGFAGKVSGCLLEAGRVLAMSEDERRAAAAAFVRDAYQFDQMACSSPHFVFVVGAADTCARASAAFWDGVAAHLRRQGRPEPVSRAVDKLVAEYAMSADALSQPLTLTCRSEGLCVVRAGLDDVAKVRPRTGGGFFVEVFAEELSAVGPCLSRADQTLSYIGYTAQEMLDAARDLTLLGVDRIVPVGKALDFSPVWDGHVLLQELTRRVTVE